MRDKAEARAFKRQQMLNLKNGGQPPAKEPEAVRPDSCEHCNGTGVFIGIFSKDTCASCSGSGFDISDPLKVIQWQASQLNKARFHYKNVSSKFDDLLNRYGVEKYNDENLLMAMRGKDLKGRLD